MHYSAQCSHARCKILQCRCKATKHDALPPCPKNEATPLYYALCISRVSSSTRTSLTPIRTHVATSQKHILGAAVSLSQVIAMYDSRLEDAQIISSLFSLSHAYQGSLNSKLFLEFSNDSPESS